MYVRVDDSTSVPARVMVFAVSSVTVTDCAVATGTSFTALTVSTNAVVVVAVSSLTLTVIVLVPLALATGVTVIVLDAPLPPRAIPLAATTPVLDELALTLRLPTAVSTSPTVNPIAPVAVSSRVVCAPIDVTVGTSFTADKVTVTVATADDSSPSEAVTVNVFAPFSFKAGS
jgi:hypothetical protein